MPPKSAAPAATRRRTRATSSQPEGQASPLLQGLSNTSTRATRRSTRAQSKEPAAPPLSQGLDSSPLSKRGRRKAAPRKAKAKPESLVEDPEAEAEANADADAQSEAPSYSSVHAGESQSQSQTQGHVMDSVETVETVETIVEETVETEKQTHGRAGESAMESQVTVEEVTPTQKMLKVEEDVDDYQDTTELQVEMQLQEEIRAMSQPYQDAAATETFFENDNNASVLSDDDEVMIVGETQVEQTSRGPNNTKGSMPQHDVEADLSYPDLVDADAEHFDETMASDHLYPDLSNTHDNASASFQTTSGEANAIDITGDDDEVEEEEAFDVQTDAESSDADAGDNDMDVHDVESSSEDEDDERMESEDDASSSEEEEEPEEEVEEDQTRGSRAVFAPVKDLESRASSERHVAGTNEAEVEDEERGDEESYVVLPQVDLEDTRVAPPRQERRLAPFSSLIDITRLLVQFVPSYKEMEEFTLIEGLNRLLDHHELQLCDKENMLNIVHILIDFIVSIGYDPKEIVQAQHQPVQDDPSRLVAKYKAEDELAKTQAENRKRRTETIARERRKKIMLANARAKADDARARTGAASSIANEVFEGKEMGVTVEVDDHLQRSIYRPQDVSTNEYLTQFLVDKKREFREQEKKKREEVNEPVPAPAAASPITRVSSRLSSVLRPFSPSSTSVVARAADTTQHAPTPTTPSQGPAQDSRVGAQTAPQPDRSLTDILQPNFLKRSFGRVSSWWNTPARERRRHMQTRQPITDESFTQPAAAPSKESFTVQGQASPSAAFASTSPHDVSLEDSPTVSRSQKRSYTPATMRSSKRVKTNSSWRKSEVPGAEASPLFREDDDARTHKEASTMPGSWDERVASAPKTSASTSPSETLDEEKLPLGISDLRRAGENLPALPADKFFSTHQIAHTKAGIPDVNVTCWRSTFAQSMTRIVSYAPNQRLPAFLLTFTDDGPKRVMDFVPYMQWFCDRPDYWKAWLPGFESFEQFRPAARQALLESYLEDADPKNKNVTKDFLKKWKRVKGAQAFLDDLFGKSADDSIKDRPKATPTTRRRSGVFEVPTGDDEDTTMMDEPSMTVEERETVLRKTGHVKGSSVFCVPEDDSSDEEEEAGVPDTPSKSNWSSKPPPRPTPAHATLPGSSTPSAPAASQPAATIVPPLLFKPADAAAPMTSTGKVPAGLASVQKYKPAKSSGLARPPERASSEETEASLQTAGPGLHTLVKPVPSGSSSPEDHSPTTPPDVSSSAPAAHKRKFSEVDVVDSFFEEAAFKKRMRTGYEFSPPGRATREAALTGLATPLASEVDRITEELLGGM